MPFRTEGGDERTAPCHHAAKGTPTFGGGAGGSDPREDLMPDRAGEWAVDEVVHGLQGLIAQQTSRGVRQPVACPPLGRLATVLASKPHEELDPGRGPSLPVQLQVSDGIPPRKRASVVVQLAST